MGTRVTVVAAPLQSVAFMSSLTEELTSVPGPDDPIPGVPLALTVTCASSSASLHLYLCKSELISVPTLHDCMNQCKM